MSDLLFPSKEWFRAAAALLHGDAGVQAASRDFGAVTVGGVIERGEGLGADFCVFGEIHPGQQPKLQFPDDEDELEELEPQYLVRARHGVARRLLVETLEGRLIDPLTPVLNRDVTLQGNLERLIKFAGRHKGVGLGLLPQLKARTITLR